MNFQSLRYFVAVQQEGSIQKAAARLHLSPQALSEHIKRLEKELETPLLQKTRPVSLTEAGRCTADYAKELLKLQGNMLRELQNLNGRRRQLIVSVPQRGTPPFMTAVIQHFARQCPECVIHIQERPEHVTLPELVRYDLNISMEPLDPELTQVRLQMTSEQTADPAVNLYLVQERLLMENWGENYTVQWAQVVAGDLSRLNGIPFIRFSEAPHAAQTDRQLQSLQFEPQVIACVDSTELCFSLCRAGVGASIVPKNWLEAKALDGVDISGFLTCTLPGAPVTEQMIVSYQKEKALTQEEEIFISLMMKALRR